MGIKQTRGFEIHPNKKPRHKNANNGIIITHMTDLLDKTKNTTADMVFDISDKNQFNEHFFYFRNEMGYEHYGYHFFFETYMNETFGYMGCNMACRSEYLSELTNKEILNKQYQDWLLVVINGNLNYDMIEKQMYTKLAYQVSGIMNYEVMEMKKLKFLWDIIDQEKAKKSNFRFAPMTNFNKHIFNQEILRFKTK